MRTIIRELFVWIIALFLIAFLVHEARGQERDVYVARTKVRNQQTVDFRKIEFFELQTSKGSTLLSGDTDLELVKFLSAHDGDFVTITIESTK